MTRHLVERIAIGVVLATLAAGCSSGSGGDDTSVTVFGVWRGQEAEAFRAVLDQFEKETGISVRYTGSTSFITAIRERAAEGDPPDVAMFPQPGLLEDLASEGYVLPLRTDVRSRAEANLLPAIAAIGNTARGLDGVPYRLNVKSLVWYSPSFFEANGYSVPTSWDELNALSSQIAADGFTPWCLGIAAGDATGWPVTDWVEDIVLRQSGVDVYDRWVAGEIPFTDDAIGAAIESFGELVLPVRDASQSRRGILNTSPARAQDPMFSSPPGCVMYKQGSFQVASLPPGTTVGQDGVVDLFVLPDEALGANPPLLIGGNVAAAMTNRSQTWELLSFLATPEAGEPWARKGDFISPYRDFDQTVYADPFDVRMARLLQDAKLVRFDGSDRMYAPVGTGSFFEAMTQFVISSRTDLAQETAQAGYDR